jgi:hypothetical protein
MPCRQNTHFTKHNDLSWSWLALNILSRHACMHESESLGSTRRIRPLDPLMQQQLWPIRASWLSSILLLPQILHHHHPFSHLQRKNFASGSSFIYRYTQGRSQGGSRGGKCPPSPPIFFFYSFVIFF